MDEKTTIEDLILLGAVEVSAIDSNTNEFLYSFTDKIKELIPELYDEHLKNVHKELMYFWEFGFIEMSDISALNPIVKLTKKAFIQEEIDKLPQDKQTNLIEIKRILKVL